MDWNRSYGYGHAERISRPVPDILNPDEPLPVGEPPELE